MFGPDVSGPLLGIDPGLSRCGYGAVRRDGSALRAIACGVLRTPPTDELPARLAALSAEIETLVDELRPSVLVVERVLFQVNARTAIAVGQASGIALAVAARAGVPVVHYSPNEVKLAVTGYGGADKAQVAVMVARLLALSAIPGPPDAADALALAICHAGAGRVRAAVEHSDGGGAGRGPVRGYERAVAAALAREGSR
ncbi:MAG TPA: crossover junction endodeoxyribonuclease RuvC [Acidimicrobiia bacterium]|nr:crossover junction endodeoxyribonuclease RuvC [Acidimicrobiia bacterium]